MNDDGSVRKLRLAERPGIAGAGIIWIVLPLAVLALAVAWLVSADPLRNFGGGAPPVEKLTFERTVLSPDGIALAIRAGGSQAMTIAQVQVDDAYWQFTQDPAGPVARGERAWIRIPYPWVQGEAHAIRVVTASGATFEHEIEVAVATPRGDWASLRLQAMLGAVVGILPIAIGLMFYPALRQLGRGSMDFLLAMTIGLLAFLLVDSGVEALELADEAAAIFQGRAMVILVALGSFMALAAAGRRGGTPSGLALAGFIALGIGLHNLGEGLAIGAAFASGAAGFGTFLVLGFTLHNVTEGIGIAAPILRTRPPLWIFAALVLLAGGPAVVGLWVGSLAHAPQWSALALAVGAGAIAQVILEVGAYLARQDGRGRAVLLAMPVMAGFAFGGALMYLTGMLVKI